LVALVRAGGDRFRGIRYITSWDADKSIRNPDYPSPPGLLADKTFRQGFAVLGRLGLSFDAVVYHPQIDELTDLAGSFPDVKIVLDHSGVPLGVGPYRGRHDEVFSRWKASIKALAAHQNVYIKLGGLGQRYNGLGFNEQNVRE
jgi:predicted TIM-barrel fold metal-dependent hydrolase